MKTQWEPLALVLVAAAALTSSCAGTPKVSVPGVIGDRVPDAVEEIEAAGLVVAYEGMPPSSDDADLYTVSYQDPSPVTGGEVEEGSEVTLRTTSVLEAAADQCSLPIDAQDDGRSLILDMGGSDYLSGDLTYAQVECALSELEVPDSVLARMNSTRALDGRQEADWDGLVASWSYHPDTGLDVIIEFD